MNYSTDQLKEKIRGFHEWPKWVSLRTTGKDRKRFGLIHLAAKRVRKSTAGRRFGQRGQQRNRHGPAGDRRG